jgi:glycosyltransferase involved in cell wall biosynthesis
MFSVVIPLYNKASVLRSTLDSVLAQSFNDFEIIIVNDGSTDNSLQIAESYTDDRIKLFSKKNGGAAEARNYGITKATHDYIAFLDADDYWDNDYLLKMGALIKQYPECGMYASAHRIVYASKTVDQSTHIKSGILKDYYKEMIKAPVTWTSATVVKRSVFDDVGSFPVGMVAGQDTFLWAKVATKYAVAFTSEVLASYNYINSGANLREGRMDTCEERWIDLYKEGDFYRNEYIARKGILAGRRYALGQHIKESRIAEKNFKYTTLYKKEWRILYVLNRGNGFVAKTFKQLFNLYASLKLKLNVPTHKKHI